jgi:serine/threonine protein kinase
VDSQRSRLPAASVSPLGTHDPRRVGPYELESKLGEGGMGAVYLGRRPGGPLVAVKVVRPELASDPAFLARFRDEVGNAQRVASFCTAQVLDHGEESGRAYMVNEYIDGPSLREYVSENGALSPAMLHGVAVGVAAALVAIHAADLVHRDLKPGNVLLSISGPRVIDFGIARALDAAAGHTATGQVIGSPGWIAPEQILSQQVTPAVDVFAWGCLVAFAGIGRNPFGTGSFQVMAARVVHAEPELGGLPPQLARLVRRALDKDPGRRPSAQELLLALVGGVGEAAVSTTLGETWAESPAELLEDQDQPTEVVEPTEPPREPAEPAQPALHGIAAAQPTEPGPLNETETEPGRDHRLHQPPAAAAVEAPTRPPRRARGNNRALLGAVAGVTLATLGVAGGLYAFQAAGDDDPETGPSGTPVSTPAESYTTVPQAEMLVRIDTRPGWPDPCHAKLGLFKPGVDGRPRDLLPGKGCDMLGQWSKDHTKIAFTRRIRPEAGSEEELWVVNPDGSGARRLFGPAKGVGRVAWSPEGDKIAHIAEVYGKTEIHLTDLNGQTTQLTDDGRKKADMIWSKDGKLAFWAGESDTEQQIYYLRVDKPQQKDWVQVTNKTIARYGVNDPHWSPDGSTMAFTLRTANGKNDIAIIGADGKNFRRLTDDPLHEMDPAWSPGGKWLAFVRGPVATPTIWAMPLNNGGKPRRIGPEGDVGHPTWY